MDHLSDIESIIQSQSWKNIKRIRQPTASQSLSATPSQPILKFNSLPNLPQSPSISSLKITKPANVEEISGQNEEKPCNKYMKFVLPYKVLSESVNRVTKKLQDPSIVPAFPMRPFGNPADSKIPPEFQTVLFQSIFPSTKSKEIINIKRKSGRIPAIKPVCLPPLYSPRIPKPCEVRKIKHDLFQASLL